MNKIKQKISAYLSGRNFPAAVLVATVVAIVVFLNIIVYSLTSFFKLYLYSPDRSDLSITDASDALFAEAIENGLKVKVTFCMYRDAVEAHSTGAFVNETARAFAEKYPEFIEIEYINVMTQLDSDLKSVEEDIAVWSSDSVLSNTSVVFQCGSNYRVITDVYTTVGYADFFTLDSSMNITSYNGEEVFASMCSWVLHDNHSTAYFTVGHGESSNTSIYNLLVCAGYNVKELNLRAAGNAGVPDDAGLVIISNPVSDFERAAQGSGIQTEIEKLTSYAERGGNILVTLDPYAKELPMLYAFLADFGIGFARSTENERQIVKDSNNAITTDGFTLVANYADDELAHAMYAKTEHLGGRVILRDVAALSLSGNAKPLLTSSASAVCQASGATTDTSGSYTIAAYSTKDNGVRETGRIAFVPSVFLTATDAINTNGYSNKDFLYSLFDEFYGIDGLPYGCRSVLYDNSTLENLTMGTARIYTAVMLAIPALLAVVGFVLMVRRKNR